MNTKVRGYPEEIGRLRELDKRFVWHPFTQMKEWSADEPVIILEGRDCFIKDISGRWYLDGVSSLWVNIHGHRKNEIDDAIRNQLDLIAHSTLLGLGSVPSIELAERLIRIAPKSAGYSGLTKVFYSDNGSTAVEVSLKMAFQYWIHRGRKGKDSFLSLHNAYHGDTLGAVSVGGIDIFHNTFSPLLFRTHKAPAPYCYRCELGLKRGDCAMDCLGEVEKILNEHSHEIAAVIIEPLLQAAGGMIVWPKGYLIGVRNLCDKHDVLMIADEVATGFGRTGRMFACEHESVIPDIMCLSKGLTSGYLPLAATLATEEIYNAFLGEFSELKTFFHGHSFTGNPLAAAAAIACIDVFEKENTLELMRPKVAVFEDALGEIAALPHVGDARSIGLVAGIELVKDKKTAKSYDWDEKMGWKVCLKAREDGVIIRPLGNVVVLMPPLCIGNENLKHLMDIVKKSIISVKGCL